MYVPITALRRKENKEDLAFSLSSITQHTDSSPTSQMAQKRGAFMDRICALNAPRAKNAEYLIPVSYFGR
jgi:hypothetical protein